MEITYLGHAGFLVETDGAIVVADPWLSTAGAFDSSWMQLPDNSALTPLVVEKLTRSPKARYLYVSHEHRDHFDPELLAGLFPRDFTVLIPRFRRAALRDAFAAYGAPVIECEDGRVVPIPGGSLRLFVEDSALNRDSALLVRAGDRTFLDLNDCKIHDRLSRIRAEEGPIHVFTAQFSGAVWHPVCYRYDAARAKAIARRKRLGKFEAVARAIETLAPEAFVASAGPACFLDPDLFRLNLDPDGIFPRAGEFFDYARKRLRKSGVPALLSLMPGDAIDGATLAVREGPSPRLPEEDLPAYLAAYAERRAPVLRDRVRPMGRGAAAEVLAGLGEELHAKLAALSLRARIDRPLFVSLEELPGAALRVDFAAGRVEEVAGVPETGRYALHARAADLVRVLERRVTWEEFLLSLRHAMSREPDRYDPLLHGFLAIEREDLGDFCEAVLRAEAREERIEVEASGRRYSVQRFCPHQGADLSAAWTQGSCLVCPRHRWSFDLERGGRCAENGASIAACRVDDERAGEADLERAPDPGDAVPALAGR